MSEIQEGMLNMDAEVAANKGREVQPGDSNSIQAQIEALRKQEGMDDRNPLAFEKLQRDLNYQRQMETLPQPESAPLPEQVSSVNLDQLEKLQQELEAAKAEATRWKKEFGRREGKVGGMESRIKELEARISQVPPVIDVRAMTGHDPNDPITAQDMVNLLMAQSNAFGNTIRQVREELQNGGNSAEPGLPLDLEAELVESHPWLTDLPRPQKMRAMHDILSSSGVTIAPSTPGVAPAPKQPQQILPERGRAQVREAAFIEPSNKGSAAERNAIAPERQALNEKVGQLREALYGRYKPGAADKAAELLAALGAGVVDETQEGILRRR
jgi:hypothetical protein